MPRLPFLGFALVSLSLISIESEMANSQETVVPAFKNLDLISDQGHDFNGIPLNPRWGYQNSPNQVSDPRDVCNPISLNLNVRPVEINPACTSQSPTYDAPGVVGPSGFPPGTGGWWSSAECSLDASPFEGHSNWFAATYTGILSWSDHSSAWGGDDDYSMNLQTPDTRGAFLGDSDHIHLEFDSDETVDQFGTSWWSDFKDAVDRSDADAAFRINGHPAIVTGLMGIDWVHTPGAESHPVYAIAIEATEGQWAFFVRNFGNEGFCSSQQHVLDGLPGGAYTFKLPWALRATDVSILPPEIHSGGIRFPQVNFIVVQNEGVLVSLQLPPPGDGNAFYDGTINLAWQRPRGTPPPPPPPPHVPNCNKVVHPPNCGDEPEGRTARVLGPMLTDRQKAVITADLKDRATGRPYNQAKLSSLLKQDAIHVRRMDHLPSPPATGPTTRAVFDEIHALRDRLQLAELCAVFRGAIPNLPKACARFSPDLK